jgi:hypothetical protein
MELITTRELCKKFENDESYVTVKSPIPFSFIQMISNSIFYKRTVNPLSNNGIMTLSSHDTMLAQAAAKENEGRLNPRNTIYEIGPGNLNFAKSLLHHSSLDHIAYTGIDFSEQPAKLHLNNKLSKHSLTMKHGNIRNSTSLMVNDNFNVYLVEILDDILNDFFLRRGNDKFIRYATPRIHILSGMMLGENHEAQRIAEAFDTNDINFLYNLDPKFLNFIDYTFTDYKINSVDEMISCSSFSQKKEPSNIFVKACEKLWQDLDMSGDTVVRHLPIEGIIFLENMSNKGNHSIDFYDYGYISPKESLAGHMIFNGQITAPVNFEIIEYIAKELGYETTLELNREYIKKNTGHDTIPLKYFYKAVQDAFSGENEPERMARIEDFCNRCFPKLISTLNPSKLFNEKEKIQDILAYRILRTEAEKALNAFKNHKKTDGTYLVPQERNFEEHSYHLNLQK